MNLKKWLNILKQFTDKKHPDPRFRYVYYNADTNELVATDTIRLFILNPMEKIFDKNVYVNVNKIKSYVKPEIFYDSILCFDEKGIDKRFPEYDKLIPDEMIKPVYTRILDLPTIVINVGSITGNGAIVKFDKKYDCLKQIKPDFCNIIYNGKEDKFMINGGVGSDEFKLLVIPVKGDLE